MFDLVLSLGKLAIGVGTAIYEAATMSPEEQAAVKAWADSKADELVDVRAQFKAAGDAKEAETRKVIAEAKASEPTSSER